MSLQEQPPLPLSVTLKDTIGFSRVYTQNGLAVFINDTGMQFATDFANVVLNNFINLCNERAAAHKKQAELDAQPKVTL
jgi:hypothetical protein